jgi:hypothetical protein
MAFVHSLFLAKRIEKMSIILRWRDQIGGPPWTTGVLWR